MTSVLSAVIPSHPDIATAELTYLIPEPLLGFPQEHRLVENSALKRRTEFLQTRHCAHHALNQLNIPPTPILKGNRGQPCWPKGIVGSLTHCQGFRGAAVARCRSIRSIGIDAEPYSALPDGVLGSIALEEEQQHLENLPDGFWWDKVLFCAKEATYKTWFPLTHRWLGFHDAIINLAITSSTTGSFTSRILIDPTTLDGCPIGLLHGRWALIGGIIVTGILL